MATKLKAVRAAIVEAEAGKARLALTEELGQRDRQLADLQQILVTKNAKLAEAQQAEVMRKQREVDDAKREVELTVEKRVQENLAAVHDKARIEAEGALKSKVTEKETQIAGMQRQIEELRRKAEQGSQQLQGEALEIELESQLRSRFPRDLIESWPRANSAAMSCTGCSDLPAKPSAPSFGNQSAPRSGTMAGSRSFATTSALRKPRSR